MRKNQSGMAHIAMLGILVLVLIAGIGIFVVKNNNNITDSRETNKKETSLVAPLPSGLLSIAKVKELAATNTPNVGLTSIELERENGVLLYKVKLANGSVLFFNALTGASVSHDQGENEAEDGNIPAGFVAGITFDKAREVALGKRPGGVIKKIELELENGKVVYSVRFADEARIDVDATSGAVVRTEPAKTQNSTSDDKSGSTNSSNNSNDGSDDSSSSNSSTNNSSTGDDSSNNGSGSSGSNSGSGRNKPEDN